MPSNNSSPPPTPPRTAQRSPLGDLIRGFVAPLAEVLAKLEPRDVPLPFAEDVFDAFDELERLGASGALMMKARVVEHGEWKRAGSRSPADWLARKQGTSTGRARAELETSERLGELPLTAGEVRAGNLSPEQAGAVADAAVVNPACEEDLLDTAKRDSLRHTKEEAARRKAEAESELTKREREAKIYRERSARFSASNGRWHLHLTGPLAAGAMVEQQISNRVGEIFKERRNGVHEWRDRYAYDAVMELLTGTGTAAAGSSARSGPVKKLMLVRVDLSALINGYIGKDEVCELPGYGSVSVHAARRMFGDSILSLVTTNGPAVVDVVNLSRQPTVAQQIAKLWTDPKCVVTGCNRTVSLEYEHRVDWADSKQTVVPDLERMCDHDHDLKTYSNWQLVAGSGRRAFVPPGHPLHPGSHSGGQTEESLEDTG